MSSDVEFSLHALLKIEILKAHGVNVSKEFVEDVVRNPDKIDTGYKDRLIAQRIFDDTHVIRLFMRNFLIKGIL